MEEYKIIKDFENYEVSNLGNVRNVKTGRIIKQQLDKYGYCRLNLYKNEKRHNKFIHRLVAQAFIENPDDKPVIDHINGDKLNNDVKNIRWATISENSQNSKVRKDNTSNIKGVEKKGNKWRSRITIDGIRITLGYYDTIEEAKEVRVKRANEVFGVFVNDCEKL